jgi:hypothetical protein
MRNRLLDYFAIAASPKHIPSIKKQRPEIVEYFLARTSVVFLSITFTWSIIPITAKINIKTQSQLITKLKFVVMPVLLF